MGIECYTIEKWLWTDADFESMGWHDVRIHAMAFHGNTYEIAFDVDYIFEWIPPDSGKTYSEFWVSPATLVFENVNKLRIDLEPSLGVELDGIERKSPRKPKNLDYIERDVEWAWKLQTHSGEISFRSVGYKQYIRRQPVLTRRQFLETDARGGFSFYRGTI